MGPSVKFVLPIIDAFPNKKNGGNFWCGKKGHNGGWGGSEGVVFFGRNFSRLSFLNVSLIILTILKTANSHQTQLPHPCCDQAKLLSASTNIFTCVHFFGSFHPVVPI